MANSTLTQLRTMLNDRISAAVGSGFWSDSFKNQALNDAGKQVIGAYRWPWAEQALTTQSRDSKEYYDYPAAPNAFIENSIYQLAVEDEDYGDADGRTRVGWGEFQRTKNRADDSALIFTNHNGFWFMFPVPADGKEISIFGLKKWRTLALDADEAITPTELDDSIVKIALAKCLRKAKKYGEAKAELAEVLDPNSGTLKQAWDKVHEESPGGFVGVSQSTRFQSPSANSR